VIVGGRLEHVLDRLHAGERLGTLLTPEQCRDGARKQWLAGHLQTRGTLTLDAGAVKALTQDHKSLLPVGVTAVAGHFLRGEMVVCVDAQGVEVARGLSNYSAAEATKVIGLCSDSIVEALGYMAEAELIHRDNLVTL
jgi:glutamate 5-kinase